MKNKIITKQDILDFLQQNKLDNYAVFVVASCVDPWRLLQKSGHLNDNPMITFDMFCNTCENLWLDCEDHRGLTEIADEVTNYFIKNGGFPETLSDFGDITWDAKIKL